MNTPARRWALNFAIVVVILTSLPYWIGYQRQGDAWRFSGFVFGVEDGNSYIAKMLRGADGEWLFRTPYTAVPQAGFLAFLPYLLLGKLSAPPGQHDQLVVLFHIFRCAADFLLIFAVYDFTGLFLKDDRLRKWCTGLVIAGGGLGWLSALGLQSWWGNRIPLEFYSPESFGFLSVFGLPHLALGRALLLWGLAGFLSKKSARGAIRPGLLFLLLGFVQPLTVVTGWAVMGMYLLIWAGILFWQKQKGQAAEWNAWQQGIRRAITILGLSSPLVLYTFISFLTDSYLKNWALQNKIFSPPPGDYLLAYGIFLPLAYMGAVGLLKSKNQASLLLIGWVLAFPFLAYAPYNLQRRLPDGIWVAVIILACYGFKGLPPFWKKWAAPLFGLSFLSAIFLLLGGGMAAWSPSTPVFIPKSEAASFLQLSLIAKKDTVVLASFETSNDLPAWVSLRTITGHGPESIFADTIQPRIQQFFQVETTDADRIRLLDDYNIRTIYYGPSEQKLGKWNPGSAAYLTQIYQDAAESIFIYQYTPK
jgi:hypothetical protein